MRLVLMHECTKCGGTSGTLETRKRKNAIKRVRRCVACRHTWQTWETDVNPLQIEAALRDARRAQQRASIAEMERDIARYTSFKKS